MTTDPGIPAPDPLAIEHLRTDIADRTGKTPDSMIVSEIVDIFPSVGFVHDVNANGVAVRRLVVHGEWEVDPNPPIPASAETCGARLPDLEGRRCRLIRGHTAEHWAEYSSLK